MQSELVSARLQWPDLRMFLSPVENSKPASGRLRGPGLKLDREQKQIGYRPWAIHGSLCEPCLFVRFPTGFRVCVTMGLSNLQLLTSKAGFRLKSGPVCLRTRANPGTPGTRGSGYCRVLGIPGSRVCPGSGSTRVRCMSGSRVCPCPGCSEVLAHSNNP